jgi:hypothetical protein
MLTSNFPTATILPIRRNYHFSLCFVILIAASAGVASAYTVGKMTCNDYADFAAEIVSGRENGQTMKQSPAKTMKDALAKVNAATDGYPDERKNMTQIVRAIYAKPHTDFSESRRAAFVTACENLGWGKPSPEELADGKIRQFQKFRLGDFSYQIKRCELRARLGNQFFLVKPEADAVFLVVRFTIANETKKTETVLSDDFTLRDGQGREFSPASKALTALMMEGENKDFMVSEIQPGVEKESLTAFEIPKTALSTKLLLIVPEKGLLGSKTVEVLVKPQSR